MKAAARVLCLLVIVACGRPTPAAPPPAPAPLPENVASTSPSLSAAASLAENDRPLADSIARADSARLTESELRRLGGSVFGDSAEAVGAATPLSVADAAVPSWDIDVRSYETHERVAFYLGRFTGSARGVIIEWMERGSQFESMIRTTFRNAGVPEDMYYLGLVESGYDAHAYSRAAAVGIWQFMTGTARGTGLRVDWWIDDRRDPVRSTRAAAKFLRVLREQFGSYYLAAAAYNGGPGRVSRGLVRYAGSLDGLQGEDVFFGLAEKDYLRRETKNYVPQLIAAALIAKEPARYGITIRTREPFSYDSVVVPPATPLAAVALASRSTLEEIRTLNSRVLRGMTPPEGRLELRVPVGHAAGFDSALAALPEGDLLATRRVIAKKGATIASVAKAAGLSARKLTSYNPKLAKLKSGRLSVGQVVLVPTQAVVAASFDVPDPAIEIYGRSAGGGSVHVVKRGETLGGIAKRYGTSVSSLMSLNAMRKSVIYSGQRLIVRRTSPVKARTTPAAKKTVAKKNGAL